MPDNIQRAARAAIALAAHKAATRFPDDGDDGAGALSDLLTDLMHYASNHFDMTPNAFADALLVAEVNFNAEVEEEQG